MDGLRAVGALLVLLSHSGIAAFRGGGLGVDLFFALSGYLITTLLLAELEQNGRIDLVRFYGRRALRLLPALFLLLVAVLVLEVLQGQRLEWRNIAVVVLYVGNWVRAAGGDLGVLGPTWSLSVEEQFYLVWPVVVCAAFVVSRRGSLPIAKVLAWTSAAGCMIALGLRILLSNSGNGSRVYNGTDTRMDNLLYGCLFACLLALAAHVRLRLFVALAFPFMSLGLIALYFVEPEAAQGTMAFDYRTVGYSLVAFAATVVVAHLVLAPRSRAARVLAARPMRQLGRISYGLYLWQAPVIVAVGRLGLPILPRLLATLVATISVAWLSYTVVEHPLQVRFRHRLAVPPGESMSAVPTYASAASTASAP